nr:unnamed protein product [Spirometra erinaceieuropaei]
MDDERLPKLLFYGDVAMGSRRQGGQILRYNDTLKSTLKRLQINPTNWEELTLYRPTWRRTLKTAAAIYEANRIAAAIVKRERANHSHPTSATPTHNRFQRVPGVNGHSGQKLKSLNDQPQRLDNITVAAAAAAAADKNGSVENC